MYRLAIFLALAAIALAKDHVTDKTEVSFLNLRGILIPDKVDDTKTRTYAFRTEDEDVTEVEVVTFKCWPLNDVYTSDDSTKRRVVLCQGEVPESLEGLSRRLVFLFSADGLEITPEEREINLLLGRNAVSNLQVVSGKVVEEESARVKRQFGFSGSGAQAGAGSVGGGFGGAGFPGGFGGGFSGSGAEAGAGSFGGGFGR